MLSEREALRAEVGEKVAAVRVLAELAAGRHVRDAGDGVKNAVAPHPAGLALHPAGVGREVGPGQGQGGAEQHQPQHRHSGLKRRRASQIFIPKVTR